MDVIAQIFDQIVHATQRQPEKGTNSGSGLRPFVFVFALHMQTNGMFSQDVNGNLCLRQR